MQCPHRPRSNLRELARQAIACHKQPGDLIIDPMCGSGSIPVEAINADRMVIGVELEKYLADVARRRVEEASDSFQQCGYGAVVHGDPLHITDLVGLDVRGRAALVITSSQDKATSSESLTTIFSECETLLRPSGRLLVVMAPFELDHHMAKLRDIQTVRSIRSK